MKNLVLVIIILILSQTAFGQQVDTAFINTAYKEQLEVLNRQFSNLKENAALSELETRYKINIITIGGCLMILELAKDLKLDSLGTNALKERLEEIAESYVAEGTPILLNGNGMNSVENAVSKNSQPNTYNIKYVSTGNSCLSTFGSLEDFGISAFNRRTLDKIGLKYVPGFDSSHLKTRKKKKKNAA